MSVTLYVVVSASLTTANHTFGTDPLEKETINNLTLNYFLNI